MLQLTSEEQAWLDAYRKALNKKHSGVVKEMLIFAKACGAHAESDLDMLLIVKDKAGALKSELRRTGYLLAATAEVLPSILAYTQEEWKSRKRNGSTFRKAVERTRYASCNSYQRMNSKRKRE